MESVESPLEVLSRAATMMQHCHNYPASDSDSFESPSTASGGESEGDRTVSPEAPAPRRAPAAPATAPAASKELPTAKWRRERRSTRIPDYKPRESGNKALRSQSFNERRSVAAPLLARAATHSDGESPDEDDAAPTFAAKTALNGASLNGKGAPPEYPSEAPIDMRLKSRPTPPPYPHPAPPRATVITHSQQDAPGTGSMSMCDPVIDEHFRRSLGDDYMTLFAKKSSDPAGSKRSTKDRGSSPIMFPSDPCANFLSDKDKNQKQDENKEKNAPKTSLETVICEDVAMEIDSASSSVDDHFAKALGDTWRKIQISRLLEKPEEKPSKKDSKLRRGVVI